MHSLAVRCRRGFLQPLLVSDVPLATLASISAFALHLPNASSSERFLHLEAVSVPVKTVQTAASYIRPSCVGSFPLLLTSAWQRGVGVVSHRGQGCLCVCLLVQSPLELRLHGHSSLLRAILSWLLPGRLRMLCLAATPRLMLHHAKNKKNISIISKHGSQMSLLPFHFASMGCSEVLACA